MYDFKQRIFGNLYKKKYESIANWARKYNISERMAHHYLKKNMNAQILTKLIVDLELNPKKNFYKWKKEQNVMGSIKNLLEKKEELKVKADAILNDATVEVRGLNAQEKEEFFQNKKWNWGNTKLNFWS